METLVQINRYLLIYWISSRLMTKSAYSYDDGDAKKKEIYQL